MIGEADFWCGAAPLWTAIRAAGGETVIADLESGEPARDGAVR